MIEITNLTKRYGRKVAVENLSLRIEPGQIFGILGPNGAGKTTTMKVLAGLLHPTSGTASVGGFDVVRQPLEAKRLLAYVPDEPYLYDKLTGREFLCFVGDLYGMGRRDIAERTEELSAAFDLGGFLDELSESYSHGMKQRVVVAAALLHRPKALVVDEPTVGLDPRSSRHLRELLRGMARDHGSAVFLSTHVLPVAEQLADRIGIMDHGRLLACSSPEGIKGLAGGGSLEETFLKITSESAGSEVPSAQ
ncbi:MAG TPA: ABC transporter ATP-binding protein [Planctomycetota bacterium]|nr:ABC transporter ATP-binding protein [Planctomycetota bacterium]